MAIPILEIGLQLINKIFPDKEKANEAKIKLLELQQNGELAQLNAETELAKGQIDVNKEEAKSTNVFVSGWRPFMGWVCGSIFVSNYMIVPLLAWMSPYLGIPAPPRLDIGEVLPVLLGMLGLGGMRSAEKIKGASGA